MQDMSHLDIGIPQHILAPPIMCGECGLQIGSEQRADECELCGAPRCRDCATSAGDSAALLARGPGGYICSSCAAED